MRLYKKIEDIYAHFRPFNDREAWLLFRTAAILEAIGWTLLIIGIACKQLPVSWNEAPVAVAGRIHGMLFVLYIMAALAFGSTLRWSIIKTIIAGCFSVPPYGSIVFEQWEARRRSRHHTKTVARTHYYHLLLQ